MSNIEYKDVEDNYHNLTFVLNDTRVVMCTIDGQLVLDTELHNAWHTSVNAIATDVYGMDTEID